jgi:DNA repair exonuclease SbcCD ATPase subunit
MSEDQGLRESLKAWSSDWEELQSITKALEEARKAWEQQFLKAHEALISREAELKAFFEQLHAKLQDTAEAIVWQEDRRAIMGGLLKVQVRKRPIEYDPEVLVSWARQYPQTFGLPKDKEKMKMLLDVLRLQHSNMLDVDLREAEKLATMVGDDGQKVFEDSPLELEEYVTRISPDMFSKIMTILATENDFDIRRQSDGSD